MRQVSRITGKTGYRGVTTNAGKFVAQIKINGIKRHLGTYKTALEAARVYDNVCKRTFGKKAIINGVS